MAHTQPDGRRFGALAPAALLLLALLLLASGAQGADVPRYVVGDVLEMGSGDPPLKVIVADVDTTSLSTPYYTTYTVGKSWGRWRIPLYWHQDLKYTEEQLVENLQAYRFAHVDPVNVLITDHTVTGGDMLYDGLSLAEARAGVLYAVEPEPGGSSGYPNTYVVGDILGNLSEPDRGVVVTGSSESDGQTWYRVRFGAVRSGDRWMLDDYVYNFDSFTWSLFDRSHMRRVAHADPHMVIVNDTMTNTGDIGWYRLSLAEIHAGKNYDDMGGWHFNTGDIVADRSSGARYIVGSANVSYLAPSHYVLYGVVHGADGWTIPSYVGAGTPLEIGASQQLGDLAYDLVDHTDPHFAVVTDPAVENGLTFNGLSLGEILEGTPGYPPESPGPIGGDTGTFQVSTTPAGASIYLEDISGARTLQGNTSAGPLNVTVYLTATPVRAIVANLTGYRDAVYTVTQYPPKDGTLPVSLTLAPAGGATPYTAHAIPGRIEAEDYDLGGEGVAYHDTTPGNEGGVYRNDSVDIEVQGGVTNVGWIRNGEWLGYTVNITQAGLYLVTARVASPNTERAFTLFVDGNQAITLEVPDTYSFETFAPARVAINHEDGWYYPVPVPLKAGTHTLKVIFHGDGQNLDWIAFEPAPPVTPSTPAPGNSTPWRPLAIPGRIEAEDFDDGGEGVAYHDTTTGNSGSAYRNEGVDLERADGVTNVGWIRDGEWILYTATVAQAGQYAMTARVASPNGGRTIAVSVDGAAAATIAVPNTGSFEAWQPVSVPVTLTAGAHTLKLAFTGDGQNLDWIAFAPEGATSTPTPAPEAGGASFSAAPTTAPYGSAVKFTVTPAAGKTIAAAWWSFDATAHMETWNARTVNPTFFYPQRGTFTPLVKLTYSDGSTENVQRTGYVTAT